MCSCLSLPFTSLISACALATWDKLCVCPVLKEEITLLRDVCLVMHLKGRKPRGIQQIASVFGLESQSRSFLSLKN